MDCSGVIDVSVGVVSLDVDDDVDVNVIIVVVVIIAVIVAVTVVIVAVIAYIIVVDTLSLSSWLPSSLLPSLSLLTCRHHHCCCHCCHRHRHHHCCLLRRPCRRRRCHCRCLVYDFLSFHGEEGVVVVAEEDGLIVISVKGYYCPLS